MATRRHSGARLTLLAGRGGVHGGGQQGGPEEDVQHLVPVGGAGEHRHRRTKEPLLRGGGAGTPRWEERTNVRGAVAPDGSMKAEVSIAPFTHAARDRGLTG